MKKNSISFSLNADLVPALDHVVARQKIPRSRAKIAKDVLLAELTRLGYLEPGAPNDDEASTVN